MEIANLTGKKQRKKLFTLRLNRVVQLKKHTKDVILCAINI